MPSIKDMIANSLANTEPKPSTAPSEEQRKERLAELMTQEALKTQQRKAHYKGNKH